MRTNIETVNTILYCHKWNETIAFYRDVLGLQVKTEADWLVEFSVAPNACLSVADAARTSIRPAQGAGITLTFKVDDLLEIWHGLVDQDITVDPIRDCRMGGQAFFLRDPDGNRVEFWADSTLNGRRCGKRHGLRNLERLFLSIPFQEALCRRRRFPARHLFMLNRVDDKGEVLRRL